MKYNFDKIIDRSGTAAIKLEGLQEMWGRMDLLPLWIADMDFETAPFVTEAIRKRCENPTLGLHLSRIAITKLSSDGLMNVMEWMLKKKT